MPTSLSELTKKALDAHWALREAQGLGNKGASVEELRLSASKAREAVLARIKAQPGPGDPAFEKRQAERKAAA